MVVLVDRAFLYVELQKREKERERERQTERQTDRQTKRERTAGRCIFNVLCFISRARLKFNDFI